MLELLLPLRHVAWGSNMNNASVCAYSYGTGFSQPHIYQAMDQLGIAQYLTRVGLLLGDVESLDEAKRAWMDDDAWQGLRRYVEDSFVVKDPVELFVVQNVVLDGLTVPAGVRHHHRRRAVVAGGHAGRHAHPVHDRLVRRDEASGRMQR